MQRLPVGTIIGAYHGWSIAELRQILDYPGKRFRISWYAESNLREPGEASHGKSVAARVAEAAKKQRMLIARYGAHRFVNLFELDGARDKKEGNLRGPGNRPSDWLRDAETVKAAGFALIAKSPAPLHVDELRAHFGRAFVPRIVFEDVTAAPGALNPGYRSDARILSKRGETVTLVVHSGAYGNFAGTSLSRARSVIGSDFTAPMTEAFWGRSKSASGFEHVKHFAAAH